MTPWHRALLTRVRNRARAAEAVLILEAASRLVRLWPRRASAVLVRALSAGVESAPVESERSLAVVHAVERAESLVAQSSCLSRAVASCVMLRRRGIVARIRVGAKRDQQGGICAHAWLEYAKPQDVDAPPTDYAVFSRVA